MLGRGEVGLKDTKLFFNVGLFELKQKQLTCCVPELCEWLERPVSKSNKKRIKSFFVCIYLMKSLLTVRQMSVPNYYYFFYVEHQHNLMPKDIYCLYTDVSCPTKLKESQSEHYCIVFWLNGIFQIVACGVVAFVNESQRIHKIFAKPRANQTNDQLQVTWVCVHYILIRYIVFVGLNFFKTPETCESEVSNINKLPYFRTISHTFFS